jgi:transposase InsO family protein
MPWQELTVVMQRQDFVLLARKPGVNVSELCRRFGISRDKGYKWLRRYAEAGQPGLEDRSRRPKSSPQRTSVSLEAEVLKVRAESNGAWGGRKIAKALERRGIKDVPAPSTITEILRRHGQLEAGAAAHPGPFKRFERSDPNALWQMDFKGHFAIGRGQARCHPLGLLDDCSRYSLGLEACGDEQDGTVRARMTTRSGRG